MEEKTAPECWARQNRCSSKKIWLGGRCLVAATAFTMTFRRPALSRLTLDQVHGLCFGAESVLSGSTSWRQNRLTWCRCQVKSFKELIVAASFFSRTGACFYCNWIFGSFITWRGFVSVRSSFSWKKALKSLSFHTPGYRSLCPTHCWPRTAVCREVSGSLWSSKNGFSLRNNTVLTVPSAHTHIHTHTEFNLRLWKQAPLQDVPSIKLHVVIRIYRSKTAWIDCNMHFNHL